MSTVRLTLEGRKHLRGHPKLHLDLPVHLQGCMGSNRGWDLVLGLETGNSATCEHGFRPRFFPARPSPVRKSPRIDARLASFSVISNSLFIQSAVTKF